MERVIRLFFYPIFKFFAHCLLEPVSKCSTMFMPIFWVGRSSIVLAIFFGFLSPLFATDYHVHPDGRDTNPGTYEQPWRTIEQVNRGEYRQGDRILFQGGQTFPGSISLGEWNVSTTPDQPVILGSYGTGPATIASGANHGLSIHNLSNVGVIGPINFQGQAVDCGNGGFHGANGIYIQKGPGVTRSNLFVAGPIEITGYCIGVYGVAERPGSLRGVDLSDMLVHNNLSGIIFLGGDPSLGQHSLADISIRGTVTHHNRGTSEASGANLSGSGIFLYGVIGAVIDSNVAYENGGENDCTDGGGAGGGPFAIWGYGDGITLQNNEAFRQRVSRQCPWDGGGFNVNGNDAFIQYNYSHDNAGPGFLLDSYPTGQRNNTVRYNISENDGRQYSDEYPASNNVGALMVTGGFENTVIHHNTMVATRAAGSRGPLVYVSAENDRGSGRMNNVYLNDNIFVSDNNDSDPANPMVMVNPERITNLRFEGNNYFDSRGDRDPQIQWGEAIYGSLEAWGRATGQEMDVLRLLVLGHKVDPQFCALYGGGTRYPMSLQSLTAYQLRENSPLRDRGLDLMRLLGIGIGPRDFFGDSLLAIPLPDVGADEYFPGQSCE